MTPKADREFDVVVMGATGFAGCLVARYFAENYAGESKKEDVCWAIAGRSRSKLEKLRSDLAKIAPELADLPILIADSLDRPSLDALAARTRVVCTSVGPYAKYGSDLVAACVAQGTDYCDLTGEVHWVRDMIDAHDTEARKNNVRIVSFSGFDSIPSDLGTLMVQEAALREHGAPCSEVKLIVWRIKGGLSGGTMASMSASMEAASESKKVRRVLGEPYALNPPGERHGPDGKFQMGVRYDEDTQTWTGPFVMASVNERVVRYSNALLGYRYGRDFRYSESMRMGEGVKGALKASGFTAGLGGFAAAMALKPSRKLLERFALPAPGEGPSEKSIENGHFTIRLIGKGTDSEGKRFEVHGEVTASKDPGYGATAVMLAEAAVCLAKCHPDDGSDIGLPGGVMTPAPAMGMHLVERLRDAGMTFTVK